MSATIFNLSGVIRLLGVASILSDLKKLDGATRVVAEKFGGVAKEAAKIGVQMLALSTPIHAVGKSLFTLASNTGRYADKLLDLKEITGLSTNSIQEFEHVARSAGVSSDGFLNVIQRLNATMPEIANGTGGAAEALDKLGISVTNSDGSFRDMNALFPTIINQLQGIEDVTERNALAQNLFGRNLKDVAPILGMTAAEMSALRKEAHDTGLVMSEDALKASNEFRIGIENIKAQITMAGHEIAVGFMPILNEQLIPFLQNTVVPALNSVSGMIANTAGAFGGLPGTVKTVLLVTGGLVAAAGPLLLAFSAITKAIQLLVIKSALLTGEVVKHSAAELKRVGILTTSTTAITAQTAALTTSTAATGALTKTTTVATGAVVKFAAAAAVNPFVWIAAALAGLAALALKTRQLKHQYEEMSAETEMETQRSRRFQQQTKQIKEQIDAMEKLRGTAQFNAAEFERLVTTYENLLVQFKNGIKEMTDEETETTRRKVRARFGLVEAAKTTEKQMTDVQRREAAERARLAAEERKRRIEELNKMVDEYVDRYEDMFLDDGGRIDRDEENALKRAKNLGASEEQLYNIRAYYNELRQRLADEAALAELDKIEESEKAALESAKRIAEANAEWSKKLQEQADARLIAEAKASGDVLQLFETETAIRARIFEEQYAADLAAAHEAGADVLAVENYYNNERERIENETAAERVRIEEEANAKIRANAERLYASIANFAANSINKLGSILSMHSRNEDMRISKEYAARRTAIEANVEDEEERAAQLAALQEEEEARKLEIQRAQAKRDKSLGIFNTIVDTARAIVRTLADMGPIAGPIMAGIIGGLGVAQTAVIASTPEPFYAGGLIKGSRDGVVTDINGVTAQVGERNQDELILPLETGINRLAEGLVDRLSNTQGGAVGGTTVNLYTTVQAGTIVATDHEMRLLARKINQYNVADMKRTGVI